MMIKKKKHGIGILKVLILRNFYFRKFGKKLPFDFRNLIFHLSFNTKYLFQQFEIGVFPPSKIIIIKLRISVLKAS